MKLGIEGQDFFIDPGEVKSLSISGEDVIIPMVCNNVGVDMLIKLFLRSQN